MVVLPGNVPVQTSRMIIFGEVTRILFLFERRAVLIFSGLFRFDDINTEFPESLPSAVRNNYHQRDEGTR